MKQHDHELWGLLEFARITLTAAQDDPSDAVALASWWQQGNRAVFAEHCHWCRFAMMEAFLDGDQMRVLTHHEEHCPTQLGCPCCHDELLHQWVDCAHGLLWIKGTEDDGHVEEYPA